MADTLSPVRPRCAINHVSVLRPFNFCVKHRRNKLFGCYCTNHCRCWSSQSFVDPCAHSSTDWMPWLNWKSHISHSIIMVFALPNGCARVNRHWANSHGMVSTLGTVSLHLAHDPRIHKIMLRLDRITVPASVAVLQSYGGFTMSERSSRLQ